MGTGLFIYNKSPHIWWSLECMCVLRVSHKPLCKSWNPGWGIPRCWILEEMSAALWHPIVLRYRLSPQPGKSYCKLELTKQAFGIFASNTEVPYWCKPFAVHKGMYGSFKFVSKTMYVLDEQKEAQKIGIPGR